MKKLYILTAIFALLTLSLNAQLTTTKKKVVQPQAQTGKVNAPNRAIVTGSVIAADGNSTSDGYQWLPVYGYYFEQPQTNQMIYTATQLDGLQPGDKITSLTFYPSGNINFSGGRVTLSLGCTSISEFSTNSALNVSTTQVATTTTYPVSNGGWTITFTTPFIYTGENLLVQVATTAGNYGRTYFYGQDQSRYQSRNSYGSTNRYYFLPKIKLDYERSSDPLIAASNNSFSFKCLPGETPSETLSVTGLNLTNGITASISGTDASLFSVNPSSLGTSGGNLTITYSPTAVGTHSATLTLSSTTTGAQPVNITLNGSCVEEVTVCDGNTTTSDLPIYGLWYDANTGQHNQMIYLADELTSLVNKDITSMTFYAPNGIQFYDGSVTFSIGTTNASSFSSATALTDNVTPVATVVPQQGETEWIITFSEPYPYTGGNLLIQVDSQTGEYGSTNFTGMNVGSDRGFLSYNTNYSLKSTLPKVTFGYVDNTTPKIEVSPQTLTISDSGTNNTFTVQGSNLGTDDVGVTVPQGSAFSTTTSDQWWGFVNNNGSISGTVTVTYGGRDLSATETITAANNLTSATVNVTYVPDLYIYCDYGASPWDFSANPAVAMTNNGDGTYTATLNNIPDNSHILFGRTTGLTYYWEGDNNRLFFGASTDGGDWGYGDNTSGYLDTDAGNDYPVKYHPIHFSEGGTYTITINTNDYTFTIDKMVLPPPENVVATADSQNQSATVTWDVPNNLPTETRQFTWNFESQSQANEWTLVNADGDNYNWEYFTFTEGSADVFEPHSGTQCMRSASFINNIGALTPNNWMISPEVQLGGTLTLWAKGTDTNDFAEKFGVYVYQGSYSSGTSGFVQVGADITTTLGWSQYTFDLSQYQGEGRIAIVHHNITNMYWLLVDDIEYRAEIPIEPESYNIYLDGQLVGNVDANDPLSYTFNNVSAGDHTAAVSAVYEGGIESERVPADFTIVPKTDPPTISVATGETAYTITATADDPNATVTMTVDGVEYTGTGSVSATIDRGNSDQSVYVSATAQESGKLVSDPNSQYVNVPALPVTPTPTITYEQTNSSVVITANGEGIITLTTSDGQTITGEGPISITIMRSIEDQTITATASAVATNHQPSATATQTVPVPALSGTPATAQEGLLRMHLLMVDQFKEDIPTDNSHPDRYGYVLKWEQPANVADHKESGTVKVEIKKTEAQVNGYYTLTQVQNDIDHDNSEITLDVLTADVGMYLPGEDPDVLYYEMQSKKDANPALGEDYITQLQYIKNAQKYEEMLATSPNKTHQYPAEETYHYFDDSTPIITGEYGVNFMTYAPSVSTWGIQRRYFETDGLDNTYGAPIWKTGVGQVRVISTEAQLQRGPQGSTQWDGVGGPCSLVFLGLEAFGDLPTTDVTNVLYEPYMFRVWVKSPGNNLRGCNLIGEHVDPNKPGEHWDGDGTCYGAEPVLVYEQLTTDGHLYKHVQSMEEGNNVEWGEKIQFGALDSGINDLVVYIRFYYRSTGQGISGNRFMLRGNRDGEDEGDETPEVPGYYATEGDDNPDITTGIRGVYTDLNKPVESVTYVNTHGMTSDQPFDGVNIVVTRYTDGTMSTTKLVR